LDDLVTVARGLVEQDQDGCSNVATAQALTSARWKSTPEHLVASTEGSAVSTGASTATATASSGTTVALGALIVIVIVKFVIHCFPLCCKFDYNDISV
jgi:hypothetical protein